MNLFRSLSHFLVVGLCLVVSPFSALAVPFWGDKASLPAGTPPDALKPGQFVWTPEVSSEGPIVMIVSLNEQRGFVYRNGLIIGYTSVSTGKPGHETPTGVFTILQKDRDHHSSIYNNAAMPDTQRLTWGGVSLHAGGLPGYPSSHGCVHLPSKFADGLFEVTPMGMTVVIADKKSAPSDIACPTLFAPVDAKSGSDDELPELSAEQSSRWEPEAAPSGPVAILVSGADKRTVVFRNGVEIGSAITTVSKPESALGTHALVLKEEPSSAGSLAEAQWSLIHTTGSQDSFQASEVVKRIQFPSNFRQQLSSILSRGTTLMITDLPVHEHTTNVPLRVVGADPPNVKPLG